MKNNILLECKIKKRKISGTSFFIDETGGRKLLVIRLSGGCICIRVCIIGVSRCIFRWGPNILSIGNIVYRISRGVRKTVRPGYIYSRIRSTLCLKSLCGYITIGQIKRRNP